MAVVRSIILISFFIGISVSLAQKLPCTNITINDGLPSNSIRCIYKDSRGLLWIGTDAGLCCFDGKTYKVFNENNGLKHNSVWSIVEDEQNNLWLSLYGEGLAKYDGKKFTFYNDKNGLVNNSIRKLYYSQKHKCLIAATENGLSLFNGKLFKSFSKTRKKRGFQIVGINEANGEIIITSSYFGVYNLKINNDFNSSTLDSLFYSEVTYSSLVVNDNYFGGTASHNLINRNLKNGIEKKITCPIIWDYAQDTNNNLYFATCNITSPEGGLYKYSNRQLIDISKEASITSKELWCLFYDNDSQILWVGSMDKGLYKVEVSNKIQFFDSNYFGLNDLQIQELYNDDDNTIWIGAKDYIILLRSDLSFLIIDKSVLLNKINAYLNKNGLNPNVVGVYPKYKIKDGFTCFNITKDNDNNIWVNNTWGLFCFDSTMEIKSFYSSDGGHSIFTDSGKLFYGSMYSDMFVFADKFDYTKFKVFSVKNKSVPRDISKIVKSNDRIWYASTTSGLYMSRDTNFYSLNANGSIKENSINDLIIDSKQHLIIGTNSGKVYKTIPKNDSIETVATYLPNKDFYGTSVSLIEESNGTLFIGTNKGINIIKNNQFLKLIDRSEGLNDLQFNDCVKDKKNNLWLATNNGLIFLNTNKLNSHTITANKSININSVKVNGQNYLAFDTLFRWNNFEGKQIELNHNENDLEILFSSNNSYNGNKDIYRYKVIGLSDNWSEYESIGKIQLRAIPHGNYQLIIEGKNIGTGETFVTKVLSIIITPPFWKTTWFLLLIIVCISVLLYWFYRIRVGSIKAKAELTQKLLETRLEALIAQMNPHFTFNAINSIQNFIIDNDSHKALHYLGEFSKLIRQTLENSTEKLMPLETEINFLSSYIAVQKMRFDTIDVQIIINENINKYNTLIPPLIIQPFIENAFEHAFETDADRENKIEIDFKVDNELLICTITDNGKGYSVNDSSALHKSKGIKLTNERLELLNKEFKTQHFELMVENLSTYNKELKGTRVIIKIPLILKNSR